MLKGINLSLILDLKQLRKLNLCENCNFNEQITFAILSERPCILSGSLRVGGAEVGVWAVGVGCLSEFIAFPRDRSHKKCI